MTATSKRLALNSENVAYYLFMVRMIVWRRKCIQEFVLSLNSG
jgi:hypothetical protein